MPDAPTLSLADLYLADETAWLEQMAFHAADRDRAALDFGNLAEYLSDMAKRDKREVVNRLIVLLVHLLKWDRQPNLRTRSWELSIQEQREELQESLESDTLRNHAEQELAKAYQKAVRRAAVETGLEEADFPVSCAQTIDELLGG